MEAVPYRPPPAEAMEVPSRLPPHRATRHPEASEPRAERDTEQAERPASEAATVEAPLSELPPTEVLERVATVQVLAVTVPRPDWPAQAKCTAAKEAEPVATEAAPAATEAPVSISREAPAAATDERSRW